MSSMLPHPTPLLITTTCHQISQSHHLTSPLHKPVIIHTYTKPLHCTRIARTCSAPHLPRHLDLVRETLPVRGSDKGALGNVIGRPVCGCVSSVLFSPDQDCILSRNTSYGAHPDIIKSSYGVHTTGKYLIVIIVLPYLYDTSSTCLNLPLLYPFQGYTTPYLLLYILYLGHRTVLFLTYSISLHATVVVPPVCSSTYSTYISSIHSKIVPSRPW